MGARKVSGTAWALALAAGAIGATGCFLSKGDDASTSDSAQTAQGDTSRVLRSTLVLPEAGCTATKIGPKHLLVAARCVANNPAFAVGNILQYTVAASAKPGTQDAGSDAPANAVAPSDDSSDPPADDYEEGFGPDDDAGAASDAGAAASDASAAPDASAETSSDIAIVAEVKINDSFAAKCKNAELCGFGKVSASDAPDVAVVILKDRLDIVPTVPVDLDPVGEADPVLVVSSSCSAFDSASIGSPSTAREVSLPAKLANHKGSPYAIAPQLVTTLAAGYVVTAGAAWQSNGGEKLCKRDIGAPLFRANAAAVAGVTSNFTTYTADAKSPVTVHHARVDATSRFKIGAWLKSLGAETVHSCSELAGGCPKNSYDGGTPNGPAGDGTTTPSDGGSSSDAGPITDGGAKGDKSDAGDAGRSSKPPPPDGPQTVPLPSDDSSGSYNDPGSDSDYADAAVAPKKKSSDKGGCNAAPGEIPTGELVLALGLGVVVMIARRRRSV